MQFFERLLLKA